MAAHYRERQALVVPILAKALRERGNEGRRIFRRLDNGDVWQESAADIQTFTNVYDAQSYQDHLARYQGRVADMLDDTLKLTDEEGRALLAEMYGVATLSGEASGRHLSTPSTNLLICAVAAGA